MKRRMRAFTLVEVLAALAIIAVLAAVLYPVLARARERGRGAVCLSNLRQLGAAVTLYSDDADGEFPYGGDPCDLNTSGWDNTPYADAVADMNPLDAVLSPYVSNHRVWMCPDDAGGSVECGETRWWIGEPGLSLYSDYGMSYLYKTALTLQGARLASASAYDPSAPSKAYGAESVVILSDTSGNWHGGSLLLGERRYNVVFADGHAASATAARYGWLFNLQVK